MAKRYIPTSMATQHPDNARRLPWYPRPVVSTLAELRESFLCFKDLGIPEYNWDWEGKFVDEAVVDRLLHNHYSYFTKNPLGVAKFLTFRIPNPRIESQFRLARAFMVAITSSLHAKALGFENPPIFEAILPLTETAEDIYNIQDAFSELVTLKHPLLKMGDSIKQLEIIPLFEQVSVIIKSADILRRYFQLYKQKFKTLPEYLRPYCARSDPALNSGLVPTVLAVKIALSEYKKLEKETGVKMYPMIGTGSLPFRGGLNPENIKNAVNEYKGVCTFTVQSAFRYDYPKKEVQNAIEYLKINLPLKVVDVSKKEGEDIKEILPYFETSYRKTVEYLAPMVNKISKQFPKRRERLQHIGLFGYSRGVGKVKLPRAIPFTGSLYSVGLPPEILSTGRALMKAKREGKLETIKKHYLHLKDDLVKAGYYLNRENIEKIGKKLKISEELREDIQGIEEVLEIDLGPKNDAHKEHNRLTKSIYKKLTSGKDISELITKTGIIRKSLG